MRSVDAIAGECGSSLINVGFNCHAEGRGRHLDGLDAALSSKEIVVEVLVLQETGRRRLAKRAALVFD